MTSIRLPGTTTTLINLSHVASDKCLDFNMSSGCYLNVTRNLAVTPLTELIEEPRATTFIWKVWRLFKLSWTEEIAETRRIDSNRLSIRRRQREKIQKRKTRTASGERWKPFIYRNNLQTNWPLKWPAKKNPGSMPRTSLEAIVVIWMQSFWQLRQMQRS